MDNNSPKMDSTSPAETLEPVDEPSSWKPFLLSFFAHVLLVTILSVCIRATHTNGLEPERPVGIVLTDASNDQPPEYLDETKIQEPEPVEFGQKNPATSASKAAPAVPFPQQEVLPAPGMAAKSIELDASEMSQVPTQEAKPRKLTEAELERIAKDQAMFAARQPKGPPTSVSVFGSGNLTGRSFLFLLDRSASMGEGGLGVIQASRSELSAAIEKLEEHHQFQVVGYHNQTVPMIQRRLLAANRQHKQAVPQFISKMAAFGSTNHLMALLTAIAYKPDVIVLLTDGGLPELSEGELKRIRLASGRTQIHCIQFGRGPNQQSQNFMRSLAQENDGSYQYVDVNRWEAKQ